MSAAFLSPINAKNTQRYLIGITTEFNCNNQSNNEFISPIPNAGTIINIPTKTAVIIYPFIGAPYLFVFVNAFGINLLSPSANKTLSGASIENTSAEICANKLDNA